MTSTRYPSRAAVRELIEFRIPEESAKRFLEPTDGTTLGESVRKLVLAPTDARLDRVREADAAMRAEGRALFTSWDMRRTYSQAELDRAGALRLVSRKQFEPPGEECGTVYDETSACHYCGADAVRIGDLRLDLRRLPRGSDLARSIAGEWVVSQRFAQLIADSDLSGCALSPVSHGTGPDAEPVDLCASENGRELLARAAAEGVNPDSGGYWVWLNRAEQLPLLEKARAEAAATRGARYSRLPVWYQLEVTAEPVPLAEETRVGIDVFDDDLDGRYRCPLGHVAGLNLLSEIHVDVPSLPADFAITRELVGERVGLLRPEPLVLVSQRVRAALVEADVKGWAFEVAHVHDREAA